MDISDDLRFIRAAQRTRELTDVLATLGKIRQLVSEEIQDPDSDEAVTIYRIRAELGITEGPVRHVIVVETNDPSMTTDQMANAVLDALHGTDNHDVTHVCAAGPAGSRAVLGEVVGG